MKRFIICVVTLLISITSNVYAEDFFDVEINPNSSFDTIGIKGKTDIKNIVVKLMETGADESNANVGDEVIAIDVVHTNENSEFNAVLKFNKSIDDGRHYLYLSGDNTNESKVYEIWVLSDASKEGLIKKIYESSSKENLQEVLFTKEEIYNDGKMYDLADQLSFKNNVYKEVYAKDISQILYIVKSDNYDDMKKKFEVATAIVSLNFGNFKDYTNADMTIRKSFWDDSDKAKNVEKYYNEILSQKGRENVITSVKDAHTMSIKEFETEFAKEVIYNSVYYRNDKYLGTEMVCEVIKTLEPLISVDISEFLELNSQMKNKVITELSQINCSDFSAMVDNLKRLSKSASNYGTGGAASTGTKGGSGISRSDNLVAPIQNTVPEIVYPFNDVKGYDWAIDAILKMYNDGIINGTGDNMFEPERFVTREEFIKMIVLALYSNEFDFKNAESFKDVELEQWYSPYIYFGKQNGLINGIDDKRFGVGEPISREDSAVFLARALKVSKTKNEESFRDYDAISEYAKDSVVALFEREVIKGDEDGCFIPKRNLSRAEAAVMVYRIVAGGHTNE